MSAATPVDAQASGPRWAERYAGASRDVYRAALLELAAEDPRLFCLDSDMGGLEDLFATALPEQYLNLGIAEANLVTVAAGMAAAGLVPYVNTISSFAASRACEQIKVDVAGNDLPVRIVVTHAGLSAGHYGPTHHALEDLAIVRALPNLTVVVPADAAETRYAVEATVDLTGPLFLRLGRSPTPLVHQGPYEYRLGEAITLRDGSDVAIVATGPYPVVMALEAHQQLARQGIDARVLDLHTLKPLDRVALTRAARETAGLVTVEDHVLVGGVGAAVCEVVSEEAPCPVRRVGVPDGFFDLVGDERQLLEAAGVSPEAIVAAARAVVATGRWR